MKAILFNHYGDASVLKLGEMPDPHPGPGEVRIHVRAAGVNPVDYKIRMGYLKERMPNQLPIIPGWDAAGVIDHVGAGVTSIKVGDDVFAYCRKPIIQYGTYAQYVVVPETFVARKPARATFEEAASIPLAALTAWQSLFDAAGLASGQTVLIHAGAGGVGGFAIQLARNAGAHVIATGSRRNHEYIRSLGAEHVVDYTAGDFRDAVKRIYPDGVDVVYDTVGGDVQTRSGDVLKKGGTIVSILAYQDEESLKRKGLQTKYVFVSPNRDQLRQLAEMFDQGKLTTRLAGVYPLTGAIEAHHQIETGHTAGKLVLTLGGL